VADGDHLERPAGVDLVPVVREFPRPQLPRAGRQSLADLVVDVLELAEERIPARGEHVLRRPEGQVTTGPQRLPGPPVADGRVDPVPGRRRVHQAERLTRRPLLELALHHVDAEPGQVLAGQRGQAGAQFDTGDPEAAPGQRAGRLARRAPHLEQAVARRQPGHGDQVVEQGLGVVWPHPVVEHGGPVERLPQSLALILRRHPVSMTPMIRDAASRHNR